jgi:hypothetical protein
MNRFTRQSFIVFVIATVLFYLGRIDQHIWLAFAYGFLSYKFMKGKFIKKGEPNGVEGKGEQRLN